MAIEPGTRLGPYEVIAPLGEGGMGVVHRARDTKLQRDVALKVLPDHLSPDPDRLARLEREAQVLASLNHPHIAHVYGLEQNAGVSCIVMELVEGPTLADLIVEHGNGMPLEDVRRIASQVVAGLEAAHERGIVHRDLKPANIKIGRDGEVKILDFGLAKAGAGSGGPAASHFTQSPTVLATSMPGTRLGTLAYMSPEQTRGLSVDSRCDVWAFGCVVYEMLTGRQTFEGETATDVIAKIVTTLPDWDRLPSDSPASIRKLLCAALEKDPKRRLQHIGDARLFLPAESEATATSVERPRMSRLARGLVGGVAIVFVASLVPATMYFMRQPPRPSAIQFEMPAPGLVAPGGVVNALAMSPDGTRLAYIAVTDGRRAVWIRPVGSVTATRVPGTEDAAGAVFWSPDGRKIAFNSTGSLKTVDLEGGAALPLADTPINASGAWNRDGIILFAAPSTTTSELRRVSATGGASTAIEPRDGIDQPFRIQPQFLPDGRHFLYHVSGGRLGANRGSTALFVSSLDSPSATMVMAIEPGSSRVFYALPGYLLFTRNNVLMAQPFDAESLQVKGPAQQVVEHVGDFAVSETGRLAYRLREAGGDTPAPLFQLTWFDRRGKVASQLGAPGPYVDLALSHDGQRVAVSSNQGDRDIWTIDVARSVPQRVTFETASEAFPVWSASGDRLAFSSTRRDAAAQSRGRRGAAPSVGPATGPGRLYQKLSSGLGNEERLNPAASTDDNEIDTLVELPQAWSDRYLVFLHFNALTASRVRNIWALPMTGDRKPFPLIESPFSKGQVQLSPDGRWMAYTTNESGTQQIVVQSFPDPVKAKTQITATGGSEPRWRRDGRELFYLRADGKLMAVPVRASTSTFDVGTPAELFQTPLTAEPIALVFRYDVAPDGQRFLLNLPVAPSKEIETPSLPITAVINWTALLANQR